MSHAYPIPPSRLLESLPWIGLLSAGVGVACALGAPGPSPSLYATFSPEDMKAWATAAAAAISALCGAAHTVILLVRHLRRRPEKPRKPRRRKPDATPPPAPPA